MKYVMERKWESIQKRIGEWSRNQGDIQAKRDGEKDVLEWWGWV